MGLIVFTVRVYVLSLHARDFRPAVFHGASLHRAHKTGAQCGVERLAQFSPCLEYAGISGAPRQTGPMRTAAFLAPRLTICIVDTAHEIGSFIGEPLSSWAFNCTSVAGAMGKGCGRFPGPTYAAVGDVGGG